MLRPFRTLRLKLTILFVAIFGALQLTLWIAVDVVLTGEILQRFDQTLIDRAWSIVETIESHPDLAPDDQPPGTVRRILEPFEARRVYLQLAWNGSGATYRSRNLRGFRLPSPASPDAARSSHLKTIETGDDPMLDPRELRLMTLHVGSSPLGAYTLQVASDLAPVRRITADMHRLLAIFIFVSLVLAGGTAWLFTKRSLDPLGVIARRAREISAARLDERLPLPKSQSEVTDLVHIINNMLARLERDFRNQQRFLADVSHELKTPLAVLLAEAQTLQRRYGFDESIQRFLAAVEEEARQLMRIVEGFLVLSRAQLSERPRPANLVSIEDLVLKAVHRCRRDGDARGVRIVPTFDASDDPVEPRVEGDEDLLGSMVENLLRNALRHSPPQETVEVEVLPTHEQIDIAVRDRGDGVPDDKMDRIFDLFYQISPGTNEAGSAGIGLSIVRAVARMHGGDVSVRNGLEQGCEFRVQLPRCHSPSV